MVAKIKSGKSIIGALNYNENKVKNFKAELIDACGYAKDTLELTFHDKLFRLTDLASGNLRTRTNAVHISLNFAVGESLGNDLLKKVTGDYMDQIGFVNQPYLVYKHNDAGHPHIHIVTTNIKSSGERISLHLLGKTRSETARKNLEIKYGLVQADKSTPKKNLSSEFNLKKVVYGKTDTKRAITNVVNEVLKSYRFTSLTEFNAILNSCGIMADRGPKDSRIFLNKGLLYWMLDPGGNKIGIPIKSSTIYGKPTMKNLEDHFRLNEILRKPHKHNLALLIDHALIKAPSISDFQRLLMNQGVQAMLRHNNDGRLYGVTFIDHHTKTVFNGSDLGKAYSANQLSLKFISCGNTGLKFTGEQSFSISAFNTPEPGQENTNNAIDNGLLESLFKEEYQDMAAIGKLQQRKRRKKRNARSL